MKYAKNLTNRVNRRSIRLPGRDRLERRAIAGVALAAYVAMLWCASLRDGATPPPTDAPQFAYIGPGAGLALVGSFLTILLAVLSALLALLTYPLQLIWRLLRGRRGLRRAQVRRVVVVGLDGLEPTLAEQFMSEGRLPNLSRLKESGSYLRLGTTWPPLSPVAWSSFSTGTNPGKHNIFDFIMRTANYRPTISSVRIREPRRKLKLGSLVIPLSKPDIAGLRRSKPFWNVLSEHGIFSAVLRVPITFPPDRFKGVQLSAMCVPDLRGTQGVFSYYVEEGDAGATMDGDVGGDRILVERRNGSVHSFIRGPVNSLRTDAPELRAPFRVTPGRNGDDATLHIADERIPLRRDRYSDWVRVRFSAAPGMNIYGICRFYLKRYEAPFELYCTPLQIDPDRPVMPIAHPTVYSSYLARQQGPFSTLGLAEDTWSLSEKVLSEDAFLEQAYDIHRERETMFFDALRKVKTGVVCCVFDGPDRIQHMFFRFLDEQHPALTAEQRASHRHSIRDLYEKMDALVGRAMKAIGDDPRTALFVMSDHGFKTFRRGVDLNAWLRDNGYLALRDGRRTTEHPYLADIDWSRTRAYTVGLAGIFVNQKGREQHGTVEPGDETRRLVAEITQKLTGLVDPKTSEIGVREAVPREKVYNGPYTENAPDIIVGYNAGWRISWDAAIGKCGEPVFSDNLKAWSGDHCVHPEIVPGVLFANRPLNPQNAAIIDLAPTVLELFGIDRPGYMDGKSLLPRNGKPAAPAAPGRSPKSQEVVTVS